MEQISKISDYSINKENLTKDLIDDIALNFNEDTSTFLETFGVLLELPEEDFAVLSPSIIDHLSKAANNPADKLLLAQSFNAAGIKVDTLKEDFHTLTKAINELKDVSQSKKDFLIQVFGIVVNAVMDTEGISKRFVTVAIEKCHEDAIVPQYANLSDSGMDLYALEDYVIKPGETKLIPTGIKTALPPGYELQVRPKSGRALKTKLRVANTPGTIDAGYRDEIKVIIENIEAPIQDITYEFDEDGHIKITSILHGRDMYIGKGEKFAQLVLAEVPKVVFYSINDVNTIESDGRKGGFGSTGLK